MDESSSARLSFGRFIEDEGIRADDGSVLHRHR
jgi:hypothetical protein